MAKKCRWWFALGFASLLLCCAAYAWFAPSGTGEYRQSPDGRFVAHATNMNRGTWFNGRVNYVDLGIAELASGRVIWHAEYFHQGHVPDYGDRSQEGFIRWAVDSSSVTIPIDANRQITIPVP
jgi:hypothetical protein